MAFKLEKKIWKLCVAGKLTSTEIRKIVKKETGLSKSQANKIFNKIVNGEAVSLKPKNGKVSKPKAAPTKQLAVFKENGDTAYVEVRDASEIRTLEQLIDYCKIDTTIWEPKSFVSNVWDNKLQVKAEFRRKIENIKIQDLIDFFVSQSDSFSPKKFCYAKPVSKGKTLILNMQDLHLGKLAFGKETGHGNYDIAIAKKYFLQAIESIMSNAPLSSIEKVVLICGSDLIHFDTEDVTTTKGTRLDGDSRWTKVFNESCDLLTNVVDKLANHFKTEIVCVYGNHARLSEYALGAYVKAFFRHHPNVLVNNDPLDRKYIGYGKTLVGFAHGDEIKLDKLPLTMMRENQKVISQYEHLLFLTGHTHSDRSLDIQGIRVMVAPALCPPDKWHSAHGYVGNNQTSQGLLLGENGLESIIYSKPPEKVT